VEGVRNLLAIGIAALAALGGAVATAPASVHRAQLFTISGLARGSTSFRDTILSDTRSRRLQVARRADSWGGPVTASDGEVVNIRVSDAYPVDPTVTQSLADFVVQLYHGDELGKVVIYVAPFAELQTICGSQAGGCYDPDSGTIVIPGENLPDPDNTSKETVLAHEYGHHVANNRINPPWVAEDWGTKRWATDAGICTRTAAGTAFPGDERANYSLNPGEAFAETYRVLNFDKEAWPNWTVLAPWNSDQSFYPNAADLEAVHEDVVTPWTAPTVATWSSRIANVARPARHVIQTPLDGSMSVKLIRVLKGTTISIVDPATGKVLSSGARRASVTVCGKRTLTLVVRAKATGVFSATFARP
jgi:hypothetical protein